MSTAKLNWNDILTGKADEYDKFKLIWGGRYVGTMRKESRRNGEYWYIYRRVDKKLRKAYVGKLPSHDSMDERQRFIHAWRKINVG